MNSLGFCSIWWVLLVFGRLIPLLWEAKAIFVNNWTFSFIDFPDLVSCFPMCPILFTAFWWIKVLSTGNDYRTRKQMTVMSLWYLKYMCSISVWKLRTWTAYFLPCLLQLWQYMKIFGPLTSVRFVIFLRL